MKVSEIMTNDPARCTLETSLHDVAQMMMEYDCGCIPVLEKETTTTPIGMITDRDITVRAVAHNKNPLRMTVGEIMTDNVITVTGDTPIDDCLATMERNQVRRVAVVDDTGSLTGIVAQADIARSAPAEKTAELVRDVSARTRSSAA